MRKREREMIEKAFIELEKYILHEHKTNVSTARSYLNKVLKEDEREKARLAKKGRRVVNK